MSKKEETQPKKRKWRWGDRSDGYLIRTINPMNKLMPFIMPQRCDACNTYADEFDLTETDKFCRNKVKEGKVNFGFLHILLAAYIRMISQRPGVNRFVSGQRIYSRNDIQFVMVVKKTLSLESPDTVIKVRFCADDTVDEVYEKFNAAVMQVREAPDKASSFDKLNRVLSFIPRIFCRWTIKFLNFLDYFGLLPKKLLWLSPFHGSMIVTSMGSLGIRPIYHHIYNFGNLPVFLAYGSRQTVVTLGKDGQVQTKKVMELKAVTDERICDGYYYASAFKQLKRYAENPALLDEKPTQVVEDIP